MDLMGNSLDTYFKFCDILETSRPNMNREQANKLIDKLCECLDIGYDLQAQDYEYWDENYLEKMYHSNLGDGIDEFYSHKDRREFIRHFMNELIRVYD